VLGGYGTGRDAVRLVGDPGEFAVVAVVYPYDGPDRIRGWAQTIYHWPAIQQALLDTPPALSIVLDWLNWCSGCTMRRTSPRSSSGSKVGASIRAGRKRSGPCSRSYGVACAQNGGGAHGQRRASGAPTWPGSV
jgi:hypothetical protein